MIYYLPTGPFTNGYVWHKENAFKLDAQDYHFNRLITDIFYEKT